MVDSEDVRYSVVEVCVGFEVREDEEKERDVQTASSLGVGGLAEGLLSPL